MVLLLMRLSVFLIPGLLLRGRFFLLMRLGRRRCCRGLLAASALPVARLFILVAVLEEALEPVGDLADEVLLLQPPIAFHFNLHA